MQKPLPGTYKPYFDNYIRLVAEGNYTDLLKGNTAQCIQFFREIPDSKHNYRYADGKWTIKEVLMHIMDTERVMSYRALTAIRGDSTSLLPAMDENMFAANVNVSGRSMNDLLEEFMAIRTTTEKLFDNITPEQSLYTTNAAGFETAACALGYIIIGHVLHHMHVIKERYL